MLDPTALSAAISVTQDLSGRNVRLYAVPDTPLGLLTRETPTLGIDAATATYDTAITALVDLSRDANHSALCVQSRDLAVGAVRRTLDYTRNTVIPHVRKVIELHANAMHELENAPMPYNIDVVYQPEIHKLGVARQFVERWENTPAVSAPPAVDLGVYSTEELMSLTQLTDDDAFNTSINKLLSANNNAGYTEISDVLRGRTSINALNEQYALATALVLTNIDTPKEGVSMSLADYNNVRAMMANVAGKRALNAIVRLGHTVNSNIVYHGAINPASTIIVNGEVYKSMIDKGLTPEIMIGNELLGRKYRSLQLLDPDAIAQCQAAYERDRAIRQQSHVLRRRECNRQEILNALRVDQQLIAQSGQFTVEGDTAEKSWGRLRSFMDKVMKTLWGDGEPTIVIAAAVCAVWYAHTDAARFIDAMFDVEKANPGLPAKEVATLATLQYIASWTASMIEVSVDDASAVPMN